MEDLSTKQGIASRLRQHKRVFVYVFISFIVYCLLFMITDIGDSHKYQAVNENDKRKQSTKTININNKRKQKTENRKQKTENMN